MCNTYSIKIHSVLIPLILNIFKAETDPNVHIEADYRTSQLNTSAPTDMIKLFDEAFQVVRVKKIKYLMLTMLKVYETITEQY